MPMFCSPQSRISATRMSFAPMTAARTGTTSMAADCLTFRIAAVVSPDEPQRVFVANDAGIYVSRDLGATWHNLRRNLPNTMFVDLVYHQGAGTLTTATYGRGIWRLKVRAS